MEDNLHEFLNERVLATREVAHIEYPLDSDVPATGVMIECSEDGMTLMVLPTFVKDVMHFELHFFVDGERVDPSPARQFSNEGRGPVEFTIRRTDG